MPFIADTRCGTWDITLNVAAICEELEGLLEASYEEGIREGSEFWFYVSQLEVELNKCDKLPKFWRWFSDNYNNVPHWNVIQDNLKVETTDEN